MLICLSQALGAKDGGDRSGGTGSWEEEEGPVRACVLDWAGLDFDWEMRLMGEREVKSSQAQLTPDT